MKHPCFILLIAQLAFSVVASAQNEGSFRMETREDYKKLESKVIEAFDWLMNTPVGTDQEMRSELHAFLISWATGTPDITIEIKNKIVPYMKQSECLVIFLGGYAVYALHHNGSAEPEDAALYATERVFEFYRTNIGALGANKAVEKLMKLKESGELKAYIKKNS